MGIESCGKITCASGCFLFGKPAICDSELLEEIRSLS
ncbi:hypothetical protein APTSU1_001353400 [Apodemus speciosus]|uniref:Uncharacterized protein n=1 Tax=Apodemus speciosus TaxID=105296 RepID=A0ABQ0FGB9_APOSI